MLLRRFPAHCALGMMMATAAAAAQSPAPPRWVGTWATATMPAVARRPGLRPFCAVTLREIVHISIGGSRIRVRFSNAFGIDPLTINDAHVALSAGGSKIQEGSDHALTFGGSSTVTVPAGAEIYSDPVDMTAPPLSNLAVSFFVPDQVMRGETYHDFADQDNYVASGDQAAASDLTQPATITSWYFLDGIDAAAGDDARAIVALGDSITDGAHSTLNANHRWPDDLAGRLRQDPALGHVAVLNEGIAGNRVLNDYDGPNAVSRIDRDVLAQDGAKYLILLESINDIGWIPPVAPGDQSAAEHVEFGLSQIAQAAHQHGMKVFGVTLTPYQGGTETGEKVREAVNRWIRTSGVFDAVIDFEKAVEDPHNPLRLNPQYDSGDHLHPNDAGYRALADSIRLALFARGAANSR